MTQSTCKTAVAIAAAGLSMALLGSTASAQDTPAWCGPNEASLALLDGFGGNSWRIVTAEAGRQEAELCPSITEYLYADGQGDTQKAISDINSMAVTRENPGVLWSPKQG